jgi:hypothetical protein
MNIRELVTTNIHAIVDTIDLHEATVDEDDGTHVCYCRWRGTEDDWYQHVAEALADKLAKTAPAEPVLV